MVTLLITRPLYEHTTHYLHFWSKKIIDFAKKRGNKILDLSQDKVNRKNLESILRKMKPELVLLNGHGEKDRIYGQNDKDLVIAGENEDLLENKIVYVVACDSSEELGPKCVENGATCYIGYKEKFLFWTKPSYATKPLEDPRAKLFLEPSNLISESLLKGHTTQEACAKSVAAIRKNIQHLTATDSPDQFMIPDLIWNMENLECLGDHNAKLESL